MNKSENGGKKLGKAGFKFGVAAAILEILIWAFLYWSGWELFIEVLIFTLAAPVCGILAIIFSCVAEMRGYKNRSVTAGLVMGGTVVGIGIIPAITIFINLFKNFVL